MKKVIYKYSLSSKDVPELMAVEAGSPFKMNMLKGAQILSVQAQAETGARSAIRAAGRIWALCNPLEANMEERVFMLIETGRPFDVTEKTKYIGTYQLYGGEIILHLFEILK